MNCKQITQMNKHSPFKVSAREYTNIWTEVGSDMFKKWSNK